jgi:hypothetical protein
MKYHAAISIARNAMNDHCGRRVQLVRSIYDRHESTLGLNCPNPRRVENPQQISRNESDPGADLENRVTGTNDLLQRRELQPLIVTILEGLPKVRG